MRLEGRALVLGLRHIARSSSSLSHRVTMLCDNLGLTLALGKGRCRAFGTLRTCREVCSLSIYGGFQVKVRWVPSEFNPADGPSRLRGHADSLAQEDVEGVRARDNRRVAPCFDAAGLDAAFFREVEALAKAASAETEGDDAATTGPDEASEAGSDAWSDGGRSDAAREPDGRGSAAAEADIARAVECRPRHPRGAQAERAPRGGRRLGPRTFLEVTSVAAATVREYTKRVDEFCTWAAIHNLDAIGVEILDALLVEFFEQAYFLGRSHDTAEQLLAALQFSFDAVRLKRPTTVPRALRAAAGFKRLAPGHSRAPLPWAALLALVGAAYARNLPHVGLALLVQFVGYLRPSELLALRRGAVLASPTADPRNTVSLLLAPWELGRTGKTGVFDESVLLRRPDLPELSPALERVATRPPRSSTMFGLSCHEYSQAFHSLAAETGVQVLDPHPYSLRHGGASYDCLVRRVALSEIKRQGRWRSDSSVRRYEKASLVALELEKLPRSTRLYAARVAAQLNAMLAGRWRPPRPVLLMVGQPRSRGDCATPSSGPGARRSSWSCSQAPAH